MRYAIQLRALVEVEADTPEHAIERARMMVAAAPSRLRAAGVIADPLRHGERPPEPVPLPAIHRAHYRDAGRPVMRDRRGA